MSEYRCSQCGETYTFNEYNALDKVPMDPDEDDPMQGSGYEKVCECGARFHSDKWSLRETVEHGDEEIDVSTVALLIPHGMHHNQWFETCLFHSGGSRITDRYTTQEAAEEGHAETVEKLERGEFHFKPTGKQIELGGPDAP